MNFIPIGLKFVLVEFVLVETVLVGNPLVTSYCKQGDEQV